MIKSEVYYEWVVEHVDEYGDIQDTYAADSYVEAYQEIPTYDQKSIALKRDRGNEDEK